MNEKYEECECMNYVTPGKKTDDSLEFSILLQENKVMLQPYDAISTNSFH